MSGRGALIAEGIRYSKKLRRPLTRQTIGKLLDVTIGKPAPGKRVAKRAKPILKYMRHDLGVDASYVSSWHNHIDVAIMENGPVGRPSKAQDLQQMQKVINEISDF